MPLRRRARRGARPSGSASRWPTSPNVDLAPRAATPWPVPAATCRWATTSTGRRRCAPRSSAARDAGTNLAFLGANTMYWRIRLRRGGRPAGWSPATAATPPSTRAPPVARHRRCGATPPRAEPENDADRDAVRVLPRRRAVPSSPRRAGGASPAPASAAASSFDHLVGIEADRVYPVAGTPRPLQVLATRRTPAAACRPRRRPSTTRPPPAPASSTSARCGGPARWSTGAPVAAGRVGPSRFVNRVTATVLREFARGPAGRRHPAHDNVARFDLPTHNLVPAS